MTNLWVAYSLTPLLLKDETDIINTVTVMVSRY